MMRLWYFRRLGVVSSKCDAILAFGAYEAGNSRNCLRSHLHYSILFRSTGDLVHVDEFNESKACH
jgi:hypothetical protein